MINSSIYIEGYNNDNIINEIIQVTKKSKRNSIEMKNKYRKKIQ